MSAGALSLSFEEWSALQAAHTAMLRALEVNGKPASVGSCQKVSVALAGLMQGIGTGLFGDPSAEHSADLMELQQFQFDWGLVTTQHAQIGRA